MLRRGKLTSERKRSPKTCKSRPEDRCHCLGVASATHHEFLISETHDSAANLSHNLSDVLAHLTRWNTSSNCQCPLHWTSINSDRAREADWRWDCAGLRGPFRWHRRGRPALVHHDLMGARREPLSTSASRRPLMPAASCGAPH
jgi:hypothetical protein